MFNSNFVFHLLSADQTAISVLILLKEIPNRIAAIDLLKQKDNDSSADELELIWNAGLCVREILKFRKIDHNLLNMLLKE